MSVYIIAEAGVNHNGSLETALRLVDEAKKAGVDCVKFQTFKTENLVSCYAKKADYQLLTTGNDSQFQQEMLKKLELSYDSFRVLKAYCDKKGICFLSTPFDADSIDFLNSIDMPFWKIPSGEVTNLPYLRMLAKTKKPVVMSTGMCNMGEIEAAITFLRGNGTEKISLLHCNSDYPTPFEDVNLNAVLTMKSKFGLDVGYSDHTQGIEVPIAAVALGATIIEKHFTLNREMEGPDHRASLEPKELALMVQSIRHIEQALGNGEKTPSPSERRNIEIIRKSIVARKHIKRGDYLTEENLTVKRPSSGISPMLWDEVVGTIAKRDFEEDELIEV